MSISTVTSILLIRKVFFKSWAVLTIIFIQKKKLGRFDYHA